MKYPLHEHEQENREAERSSLQKVNKGGIVMKERGGRVRRKWKQRVLDDKF